MTLLDVERIKLFSTRSPWWCMGAVVVLAVAASALFAGFAPAVTPASTQLGTGLGGWIVMVMAALAVTTEYRFGTIRVAFVATPNRVAVLAAKTVFVTAVCAVLGLVVAMLAWAVAIPLAGGRGQLALDTALTWRGTAGYALVYAGYAIFAIGVAMLVRQSAAAIAILLVWALVVEQIVGSIFLFALDVNLLGWLPFQNATNFTTAGDATATGTDQGAPLVDFPFGGPWGSLAYFLGVAAIIWGAGLLVTLRRDA
jgi:ABC-2 type transport system permease protein